MNKVFACLVALSAGAGLGIMFFGGLWWTIRKGVSFHRPELWFLFSMLLRTSIVLAGFYFVAAGHWQRLLLCLSGFIVARLIVMRFTQPAHERAGSPQEVNHAA